MTDADLDRSYSVLCESMAQVGPQRSELFLSMLCLSLMARYESAGHVLELIESVRAQCDAEVRNGPTGETGGRIDGATGPAGPAGRLAG